MIKRICGPMSHRPLHGTTDVFVRIIETGQGVKYEIRMGWTFPDAYSVGGNDPFHSHYMGNYIRAVGYYRLRVAWEDFKEQMESLAESYWV